MDSTWQGHVTRKFRKTVQIQIRICYPIISSYFVTYRKLQNFFFFINFKFFGKKFRLETKGTRWYIREL
jgi:hypothetical protein